MFNISNKGTFNLPSCQSTISDVDYHDEISLHRCANNLDVNVENNLKTHYTILDNGNSLTGVIKLNHRPNVKYTLHVFI